jgi:methionine-R-sulfoxide reductase
VGRDRTPDDAALRKRLTPEQYQVTQEGATDPPFRNRFYDHHEDGTYHCVVCGEPLFASACKFDSGSGWPSFTRPAEGDPVESRRDLSHGMVRDEVVCRSCGAHLGHLFPDGPPDEGGLRYCINSSSLDFDAAGGTGKDAP